ncbi:MAG: hypothetical protein HYX92_07275 [Chloroflexi bacterium]|nr:hypothetical protein [Chloroflexota bacterium]
MPKSCEDPGPNSDASLAKTHDTVGKASRAKPHRADLATAIASESSLKKGWLSADEDEAWKDL